MQNAIGVIISMFLSIGIIKQALILIEIIRNKNKVSQQCRYGGLDLPNDEKELIKLAYSNRQSIRVAAMIKLRDDFDESYQWCCDCDGLLVTGKHICISGVPEFDSNEKIDY